MTHNKLNIAFVSTYLPRECGLATFTSDLIDELRGREDFNPPQVVAVNNNRTYAYGEQVVTQINQQSRMDYTKTAIELNRRTDLDLIVIQHEFGIYGGESGVYILDFVEHLTIPFVVIFHTVLTHPTPIQRAVVKRLGDLSARVVTMAEHTVEDLKKVYGITPSHIQMIHHGVPFVPTLSREALKINAGHQNRPILSTFGFLSPGKGIEYAIEAMSGVIVKQPDALYRILGKTHPVVQEEVGEVYRQKLMALVTKLGLERHVEFVDKLLTQTEIVESLVLSDVYLTPYLGQDQAVSGTLAYGVGYGRVIISTPYRYASEMLAGGRGILVGFRDPVALQTGILRVLEDPQRKLQMEAETLAIGLTMRWSEVGQQYAALFRERAHANSYSGRVS